MHPDAKSTNIPGAGMVLARGRFDEGKIEALMRAHGADVLDYNGKRLIVAKAGQLPAGDIDMHPRAGTSFALSFMEPGLAAIGSTTLIKSAIDLHKAGNNPQAGLESVTGNEELMNLVRSLELAREVGAKIFGIVGRDGGYTKQVADACVVVPTVSPDRITPHTEGFCAVVWHLLVSHPKLQRSATKWESVEKVK